jgi:hypothetical protein
MTEFLKSFQTPNTWTDVILVTILGTIITTYLIRFFDAWRNTANKKMLIENTRQTLIVFE